MMVPRSEKVYEEHAWILLFAVGIFLLMPSLAIMIVPEPLDALGVKNLTGVTWEEIVSRSPQAASLTRYFVRQFGIGLVGFSIFVMGVSALSYKKGERWAWYLSWFVPIVLLGYIASNLPAGGSFWIIASGVLIIALPGLLLPYRKFF